MVHRKLRRELVRYGMIGVLGTVVDAVVFWFLLSTPLALVVRQWLSALAGMSHNHLWHHYYAFEHKQRLAKTYVLAAAFSIIAIFISGPLLVLMNMVFVNVWVAKAGTIGIITVFNYIVRKVFVFRTHGNDSDTGEEQKVQTPEL